MVVVGRIVAPFGIHGWVRIHPFADDLLALKKVPQWWLSKQDEAPDALWQACVPETVKQHGNGIIVKLKTVDDRTTAENLDGCFVGVLKRELPKLGSKEYYWDDLIGLTVVNLQAEVLGKVATLLETGVHAVLVVKDDTRERLLPFVAAVVQSVNLSAETIQVDWGSDW
jgi:16S rRNA processing protein RimM